MPPTLGEKLKKLRDARDLSQAALARQLRTQHIRISQQSLSLYEQDKLEPPASLLRGLADFYHVSLDWLLPSSHQCCQPNGHRQ